ncbi:MAG: DUF354 domain-containing protein, partial [Holosporaceae bacterium]|nr:DUF354 domain-containing protein [Holosporaceae bacterium]
KIKESKNLLENEINGVLNSLTPDFIITGTSSNDFTEKYLWKFAKNLNIPTMAILDHWCNYGIRFSKYGSKDINKYKVEKTFDFLPSYICVMDDFAKSEMQKEGVPADMIYALGNPHFETIKNKSEFVDVKKIRSKFLKNNKNNKIVTFASEAYEEDYGVSPERKALNDIAQILNQQSNITFVVKLHPKENESKYCEITQCILDKETDPIDMIMASDIIISMTSMFLIEAAILGKKIISYQPTETDKNKFILTKNNMLKFINNYNELNNVLTSLLNVGDISYSFAVDFNATNNILDFVGDKICRN